MSLTCLSDRVTVATDRISSRGNRKDVVDRVIGLIKMLGARSRIRKVAIVANGEAMLPKALVEIAPGFPNVLFAPFFDLNEIDKVFAFTV